MKHAKTASVAEKEDVHIQEFLDMIAPSVIKFETDYFICGNTYRCVWALREYPTSTEEQAILKRLGEKDGVTLKIYTRHVSAAEERKIISNAASKNRLNQSSTNDLQQTVQAESNLQDVAMIVARTHRNREPLLHTAVYMELTANEYDRLKLLQTEVLTELIRSKLNVDRLLLRQKLFPNLSPAKLRPHRLAADVHQHHKSQCLLVDVVGRTGVFAARSVPVADIRLVLRLLPAGFLPVIPHIPHGGPAVHAPQQTGEQRNAAALTAAPSGRVVVHPLHRVPHIL